MRSQIRKVARRSATGLAAFVLATAACAADNGFVDLATVDHTPNGEVDRALLEPTVTSSLSRRLQGERSSANASLRSGGKGTVAATAVVTPWSGGPGDASATATAWIVDVITFTVANAKPQKKTTIRIESSISGTSGTSGLAASFNSTYCLGTGDCTGTTVPAAVVAGAEFPPATGLVSPSVGSGGASAFGPFSGSSGTAIVVQGARAVVPMILGVTVSSWGGSFWPGTNTIDGSFAWSIHLPAGVTCTSRTGLAFKGRCPAAAAN